ncbi:hypothetical protein BKA56DRAFT_655847 [Ilyonectria sp. MPI-CAGE-AT-0026]|nr:hypothetical protein BKA56DRAFT_655847 [Ilyonectria sp. MPI-CAGE-AT-0026]
MSSQGQNQGTGGSSSPKISGPPYLITTVATLGGTPVPSVDDPICGVLIAFFLASAIFNMAIYQINRKRNHKFLFSALFFGFSMARIVANALRIAVGSAPTNVNLRIASQALTNAGVILLFVVNLIFSQRIFRAHHPQLGWSKPVTLAFRSLLFSIIAMLIMSITVLVYGFYTIDPNVRSKLRTIQLFAVTYIAILAFIPAPITVLAILLPRKGPIENFGQGSMQTKVRLVLFTSLLLAFGAGFRAGVAYMIRPATNPAWFHHKACFYLFNFGIEIVVVYSYALLRFDRRFHIPNGSSGPGDYSQAQDTAIALDGSGVRLNTGSEETVIDKDEARREVAGFQALDKRERA